MKISNKIIMGALWLTHFLNPPLKDAYAIYAHAKTHNEKQVFRVPKSGRIDYDVLKIRTGAGSYKCFRMKKKGQSPNKALLYIFGGGGVYDYSRLMFHLAKKLLRHVDAEIYYPLYPLSTECPIKESHEMIFESYRAMLESYSHEKIGALGVSFGGTAAMTMLSWNNYYKENLPMPALTIALSPGHVPADSLERKMLEAYRGVDPFIPVEQIEAYGQIQKGEGSPEFPLLHTAHGDFRNAGKVLIYYGEKECLAFAAPIYEASLERAKADYRIHIEPGMPHCYGAVRINKTTARTYDEIAKLLNSL